MQLHCNLQYLVARFGPNFERLEQLHLHLITGGYINFYYSFASILRGFVVICGV
uniref:Uncharacterized protein n=1 Tax=Arundo donax TaxID=35708 RepID=A0A0A8ZZ26_ARUDO